MFKAISNFFTLRSFGRMMFDLFIFFFIFALATAETISVPQDAFSQVCDADPSILVQMPLMNKICIERNKSK